MDIYIFIYLSPVYIGPLFDPRGAHTESEAKPAKINDPLADTLQEAMTNDHELPLTMQQPSILSDDASKRKHVSKACLECRKRHFKCTGEQPICARCVKRNTECTYVESHRGGSRKKGVRKKDSPEDVTKFKPKDALFSSPLTPNSFNSPDIEDLPFRSKTSNLRNVSLDKVLEQIHKLPCSSDPSRCASKDCEGKQASLHFKNKKGELDHKDEAILDGVRKRMKLDTTVGNLDCIFSGTGSKDDVPSLDGDLSIKVTSRDNFQATDQYDQHLILKNYYQRFHNAHPVMPPRNELDQYILSPDVYQELLLVMKIIGDGQVGNLYSKDLVLISDRLLQCVELVKNNNYNDLVSLQTLLLVAIAGHISSLHIFSRKLRQYCILLIKNLQINTVDMDNQDSSPVLKSPRLQHLPKEVILENARRTFWELHFFEVIIGSADGKTITKLAEIPNEIFYPSTPTRETFDYKGRADSANLVISAVRMNVEILNKRPFDVTKAKLRAALSSREMELEDPKMFNAPTLLRNNGDVNEGVHQAILLYNYAKVFAYRPFSYLWKINSPQNPGCSDEIMEAKDMPTQIKESSAIIDTRKTIDAANSIVDLLINTCASKVVDRTPLFACALALSSLVHISAYIWAETTLQQNDYDESKSLGLSLSDLEYFADYIKLALSAIYPISNHWILSGNIAKHIRDSLHILRPRLYSKMKDLLPQVEIKIEKMSLLESKGEPMPQLSSNVSTSTLQSNDMDNLPFLDKNVVLPNDNLDFTSLNGQLSPITDSGCDWIDKALSGYFDNQNLNFY